jgi:hypothetical protein
MEPSATSAEPLSVMKLTTASGNSFELGIVGYEHPDITEGVWESNWLVMSGAVTLNGLSWRFVDPCVTTFELADLAGWLEKLPHPTADGAHEHCSFTEPNLEFSYAGAPESVLRIRFAHESAPPHLDEEARFAGVVMELPLSEVDLRAAAGEIRNALIDFPIRGGAA